MREVYIGTAVVCLLLGVFFLAQFFYSIVAGKQIDPVMLLCVAGEILTARAFCKRAKQAATTKAK